MGNGGNEREREYNVEGETTSLGDPTISTDAREKEGKDRRENARERGRCRLSFRRMCVVA